MSSYTVNFCREDASGEEQDYEVTGSVSRYYPARVNCSNDDACPAEGGDVEIEVITLDGEVVPLGEFSEAEVLRMEEQISEAAMDDGPDYDDEPDYDE